MSETETPRQDRPVAVGVDACRAGWVAVVVHAGGPPAGVVGSSLAELAAAVPKAAGFGVDIPIGLPLEGERPADLGARALLGPRRASIFVTPVREALLAPTYQEASAVSRARTGKGISRQAYGLRARILEAERWLPHAPAPVWEVHPELSFTTMLGHPPRAPKKTWSGLRERLAALEVQGITLDGVTLPPTAQVQADDVVDAAAAAWTAARLLAGEAGSVPERPPLDAATGRPTAIWF